MTRTRVRRRPLLALAALLACTVTGPLAVGAAGPAHALHADDPAATPGDLPVQVQVDAVSPAGALDRATPRVFWM